MMRVIRGIAKAVVSIGYRFDIYYVRSRNHLPLVLNAKGLNGQGAEVGVSQGAFSELLLDSWRGRELFSIDPWKEFSQDDYRDLTNVKQENQDQYFAETTRKLSRFGSRSTVMRMTSEKASKEFSDGQLDFVYLDAQHHYEAVKQDIALWHPKVRGGGILAGHDYIEGRLREGDFGVKSAVDQFVKLRNLKLNITSDPPFPTWFVIVK